MFILLIIPLTFLFLYTFTNDDIFNKFSYLITSTGYLALIYLVIVLMLPYIKSKLTFINPRSLGLSTFYLSVLHFSLYAIDNNLDIIILQEDLLYRNYIISGYIALILFIPMYLTSYDYYKKIIPNWRKIHKIIYIIYILILLHIYFIIKADYLYLFIFIMVFFVSITLKLLNLKKKNE